MDSNKKSIDILFLLPNGGEINHVHYTNTNQLTKIIQELVDKFNINFMLYTISDIHSSIIFNNLILTIKVKNEDLGKIRKTIINNIISDFI